MGCADCRIYRNNDLSAKMPNEVTKRSLINGKYSLNVTYYLRTLYPLNRQICHILNILDFLLCIYGYM